MLKLIAMLAMVIDHIGALFFPEDHWFRIVGRLSMPIFAYAIARGYFYTRSRKRYFIQLLSLALVSQIPFMLAFPETFMLNMVFPWALTILALAAPLWGAVLMVLGLTIIPMDYTSLIILLPLVFYHFWFKKANLWLMLASGTGVLALVALSVSSEIQWWALLTIPLIVFLEKFDSKVKINKWFFYWFYPVHLLILWAIHDALFKDLVL